MIQMNALKSWNVLSKFSKKEMIDRQKRLDEASHAGDVSSLIVLLGEDEFLLDRALTEVGDSPLHIAAFRGHVDFTSEILRLKPELAKKLNMEDQSPLHLAAARGHLQVADKLVDQVGTEICFVFDKDGYLPIHIAAIHGNNDLVVMFIERCQQTLPEPTKTNETLLHLAVKANSLETIHFLMSRGAKLNAKDDKGNTCLHIAVARRNYRVITDLLRSTGTDINSINATGQTPLDVLCESWQHFDDVSLVNMIRTAGGMRAVELTDLKLIPRNSSAHVTSSTLDTRKTIAKSVLQQKKKKIAKLTSVGKNYDAGATLLVVAVLVATITFQALLNPPGGFFQGDSNNTVSNSPVKSPPAGTPVLLKDLQTFYVLGSIALIASVSVILLLLGKVSQNKIFMKFLVWVVWFAVFCTALAFTSAFSASYSWDNTAYRWILHFIFKAWFVILLIASWSVLIRAIVLLVRYGNLFKGWRPNWVAKLSWPKLSWWLKMAVSIISIVIVLAILLFVTFIIFQILIIKE